MTKNCSYLKLTGFFRVKTPTIQWWSTNKLKYHTIFFDNCSADLKRTVAPFSLQDTEYIWFKQSNPVEIQKQNRRKSNMKSWTSLIRISLAFCKMLRNAVAEENENPVLLWSLTTQSQRAVSEGCTSKDRFCILPSTLATCWISLWRHLAALCLCWLVKLTASINQWYLQ